MGCRSLQAETLRVVADCLGQGSAEGIGRLKRGTVLTIASFLVPSQAPTPTLLSPQYVVTGHGVIPEGVAELLWQCPYIQKGDVRTMPGYQFGVRLSSVWTSHMIYEYFQLCLQVRRKGVSERSAGPLPTNLRVEHLPPEGLPWPAKITVIMNQNHSVKSVIVQPDTDLDKLLKQATNRFKSKKKMKRIFLRDSSEVQQENWHLAARTVGELFCSAGEPFSAPNLASIDKKCNRCTK